MRTEQLANKQTEEIWTFRVERFDDAGKRVALMPVEMRGETFHGSISEGERVRVVGRMRAGTLYATGLENLSTGAGVRVKKAPVLPKVIFAIIFLAVLGWIAYAAYMATTSGNGSSNGLLLPPIGGL
ncbi:hypothetical protein [Kitasatospora sp. MAA4]|uniref:hypothetical protein n=1 Tax=Kitasatospora sp. MAA4 TaxID=3035093 RepID=UPI002475618C|nr:hypothetical protein [Kitasatospora sp. MAA4]